MFISIYISKTLILILIYCVFKILFYSSASTFFKSSLPTLYFISITKLFSFILFLFKEKITKKIQSIENPNNNSINEMINEENLIEDNNININHNLNRREMYIYTFRKKLILIFLILCSSILEIIFYASFNKMNKSDSLGKKRALYYLKNNKLCFLLELSFIYYFFYKKYNNIHNIISLFLLFFSQFSSYILNYDNDKHYSLLLYSFFMNILYASQNFIEKEINGENENKMPPMIIMGFEGMVELFVVFIFNIGVDWYFGESPITGYLIDSKIVIKSIFMMLCILLSEYIRLDILNKCNPFYICFCEEIIYICYFIYYNPFKELKFLFFHFVIIFSYLVFIETIELNFCGLNHKTQRYLIERRNLNDILNGIANISNLSTGSGSNNTNGSGGRNNNNDDILIIDDILNFDINNNNEKILLFDGKIDKNENSSEKDKNLINLEDNINNINKININNINIGTIIDEENESNDKEKNNTINNNLIE